MFALKYDPYDVFPAGLLIESLTEMVQNIFLLGIISTNALGLPTVMDLFVLMHKSLFYK
jgi:hypothetical protein